MTKEQEEDLAWSWKESELDITFEEYLNGYYRMLREIENLERKDHE